MRNVIRCGYLLVIFAAGCSGGVLQERADTSAPPASIDLSPAGANRASKAQKEKAPPGESTDSDKKEDAAPADASATSK